MALIGGFLVFTILFLILGGLLVKIDEDKKRAIDAGQIQVGMSSYDMEGKKYIGIKEKLEAEGFTNITVIDLQDAGLFKNKSDTIESVTIDGESSFSSSDFFDPDAKIIISYH